MSTWTAPRSGLYRIQGLPKNGDQFDIQQVYPGVDPQAAVGTHPFTPVPYQYEPAGNWWVARCSRCQTLVGYVMDEALYAYPVLVPQYALHRCPCTCGVDPYNCPVGLALVRAIIERKGNQ